MDESSSALTPEQQQFLTHVNTTLSQPSPLVYQGVIVRGFANFIDQIIAILPAYFLTYTLFGNNKNAQNIITIAIFFAYFIISEGSYGQTIGKKLFHIKVVMEDGRPCTWGGAIVRNIGRIFDVLLGGYILGLLCIGFTKKKQRIGDMLAKTIVIKV